MESVVDLPVLTIAGLAGVAACAGFIDAIAGGGGLLTVPALLSAGLPAHFVFGTNKGAAVFGSGAALWRFWRARLVDPSQFSRLFRWGFIGSLVGAAGLLLLDPKVLKPLVLVLLVVAGVLVTVLRPKEGTAVPAPDVAARRALLLALTIGAYDGFFGPGTGTFLIVGFVGLLGASLPSATANAKVVNFASNLAAMLLLAARGVVLWKVSLPMALGQFIGGTLGAQVAVKGGARLIRLVVLGVVVSLVAKLGYELRS